MTILLMLTSYKVVITMFIIYNTTKSWQRVPKLTFGESFMADLISRIGRPVFGEDTSVVERHRRYFIELVQTCVDNLSDLESALRPWLDTLGKGHAGFKIKARHWEAFSESLLFCVTEWVGPGRSHKETVKGWMVRDILLFIMYNNNMDLSLSRLISLYTSNLPWSLFLTSTALHAIALITSPVQAVYKWYRRQSSDSDTCLPYICAVVGSGLWLRYSVFLQDTKLILLQAYAVTMQMFFLFALLFYRSKKRRLLRLVSAIGIILVFIFYYIEGMNEEDGKETTGRIASAAQIAGSLICPYLIYKAISSRCIDFVPLAPVAFTWIMELHAIIYSIGIDDFYMLDIKFLRFAFILK
uniref:Sugar transporter SWEET1 n=1 Tax=Heterorhabditis bacteriophora TaxID=37862 RepID=A0A1I7X2K3_HETBA